MLLLCGQAGLCSTDSPACGQIRAPEARKMPLSEALALRQSGAGNFLLIACSVSRFYKNQFYFK
jgi:hypothetical protein